MGLSVWFVRVEMLQRFSPKWDRGPQYFRVGSSHYATAAQRAIREAFKNNNYSRHKVVVVKISRRLHFLLDPKEQYSLLDVPTIGKFPSADREVPRAGPSIVHRRKQK